jgi:hypothetical protein
VLLAGPVVGALEFALHVAEEHEVVVPRRQHAAFLVGPILRLRPRAGEVAGQEHEREGLVVVQRDAGEDAVVHLGADRRQLRARDRGDERDVHGRRESARRRRSRTRSATVTS